jgi:voltage-gated potassium channel
MVAPLSKTLRRRVYEALEPSARKVQGISWTNKCIVLIILAATLVAILATEPTISAPYQTHINIVEIGFGLFFVLEYGIRIWVCVEGTKTLGALRARIKFLFSFAGLLDLLVIVATFSPLFVTDLTILRLFRLFGVLRLAKLGRMSLAMRNLTRAVHSRRYELALTMGLAMALMVFGAAGLYWAEGGIEPEKFGSIPRALWWAVITLTTIGYGDVYPVTPLGKLIASIVAFAGIGLIAMPTGILAAAFSDAMRKDDEGS